MTNIRNSPVFPLPLSFMEDGKIDKIRTGAYLRFLKEHGVQTVMTTAGTTQFNLLSPDEIHDINRDLLLDTDFKNYIVGFPIQSLHQSIEAIRVFNVWLESAKAEGKQVYYMFIYPDRYYDDNTVVQYFKKLANASRAPIFIHGLQMRKATGGQQPYTSELVRKIAGHSNIRGIKEESPTFDQAFKFCNNLKDIDFNIVVAGGDQRRFLLTAPVGATTFLAGAGSVYPEVDQAFFDAIKQRNYDSASLIMNKYHVELYDLFCQFGWHLSLREALRQKRFIRTDRQPFPSMTKAQRYRINCLLEDFDRDLGVNNEK